METELRMIKVSHYYSHDEDEHEEEYYAGKEYSVAKLINKVRCDVKRKVRNEFEIDDSVSERIYSVDYEEVKKNHPVLEYKARYFTRAGNSTIWEIYYMVIDIPNVVTTFEF